MCHFLLHSNISSNLFHCGKILYIYKIKTFNTNQNCLERLSCMYIVTISVRDTICDKHGILPTQKNTPEHVLATTKTIRLLHELTL